VTRIHIPVRLRWSDFDAYAHVNNAEMLRILEEARIEAFWRPGPAVAPEDVRPTAVIDAGPAAPTFSLIARQEIEYLAPIPYQRAPIDVELWIGRVGGASFQVCYEIYSPAGVEPRVCYTLACTDLVLVEAATGRPTRLPDEIRELLAEYIEEPVRFRKRS
jgi:acyl-CoA thioester hydrolase